MSYATAFNLLDGHGSNQPFGLDRYFKQTLATSVAFHVFLFIVLVSIRVTPVHDRPLASYQIELVDLSEQQPSLPAARSPKKKSAPVSPVIAPPVESPPPERLAETFAGALKGVTIPDARPVSPAPSKTPSPGKEAPPATTQVQEQPLTMQAPPDMPQLATRERPIGIQKPQAPSVSNSAPLGKSLQQAVEAVSVPQSPHRSTQEVPAESKAASSKRSPKKLPLAASNEITLPPEAPKLAAAEPMEKLPERPTERVKKSPLSETLQQAIKSVVIPDRKSAKSPKQTPSTAPSPRQSAQDEPTMPKIVLPPQAPELATVDPTVSQSNQSTHDSVSQPVQPKPDELGSRIAKLTIPDVDRSQPHETLSGTKSNKVKTKTNLKVSGSSPDGNPYWGRVWAKIDQEWIAPPVNVHQGNILQVILEFRLERTGTVKNLTIQQTSGNGYYDLAAKRAVLAASPLPGFPPDMTERHFTLQFQFTVNER